MAMNGGPILLRTLLGWATFFVAILAASAARLNAQGPGLDLQLELVDPKVLRVCADPNNLPFSNRRFKSEVQQCSIDGMAE
jgi:hypothetical protein